VYLEELEGRALLSSVQPLPVSDTAYTLNWSGYVAQTNLTTPASGAVTEVDGSWTVPTVTGKNTAFSSIWVGIDGWSSGSVEQIGTEQDTSRSGATYYAWWEMFPNPPVQITTVPISPGDSMSASVKYSSGAFSLQIMDITTGQSSSTTQTAAAQRSSAEWIVEAPSSFSGVLPLANFGMATISGAQATINGTTGAIDNASWQNTSIDMTTKSGKIIAHASGLTDTTSSPITSGFNVTFTASSGGKGGGQGHGHGPVEIVLAGPSQSAIQALAAPEATPDQNAEPPAAAKPNQSAESPAAPAVQDGVILAPLADPFVPQIREHGPASELETWRST
jgi:hypothetical protein